MDDITKAISDLEKQIALISSEASSDEESQTEEKEEQSTKDDEFQNKQVIKINEEESKMIRDKEIIQQALGVDNKLKEEDNININKEDDEIDLESLDLEWRYSIPTVK